MSLADITLNPTLTNLPGSSVLLQFANGLAAWALVVAGIALVVGAALWAFGSHSQNMHQSMAGRRTVVTALGAALLIGAASPLINFFFHAGGRVH